MLAIIFYCNALVAALSCIILGLVGLPLASFVFCAYAILCVIMATILSDE